MTEQNHEVVDDLARVDDGPSDADLFALVDDATPATSLAVAVREMLKDAGTGRVDILPAEFLLPPLVRFVPNQSYRAALEDAVARVVAIDVAAPGGLEAADAGLGDVRDAMKAIEAHFDEPKRLAYEEHKRITGTLADWLRAGDQAIADVGRVILAENDRRTAAALEQARREQEALDNEARAQARQEVDFAIAAGAPAEVVAELDRAAETATSTTVAVVEAPVELSRNSVAKGWKCRLVGTQPGAEINPGSDELTPAQVHAFESLLKAILEGRASRACVSVNWSYVNKRAAADKTAMQIPGLEAVQVSGLKGRGGRGAR